MIRGIMNKRWPIVVVIVCVLSFAIFESINLNDILQDISGYIFLETLASLMPLVGYIGLFFLLFIENTPLPFPGELSCYSLGTMYLSEECRSWGY